MASPESLRMQRELAFLLAGGGEALRRQEEPSQIQQIGALLGGLGQAAGGVGAGFKSAAEGRMAGIEAFKKAEELKALQREKIPVGRLLDLPTPVSPLDREKLVELANLEISGADPKRATKLRRELEMVTGKREEFLRREPELEAFKEQFAGIPPTATLKEAKEIATTRATLGLVPLREAQAEKAKRIETIDIDKIIYDATGISVRKVTKTQFDAILKALTFQAKSNPNKPLTPFQAMVLGVPFGTSAKDAEGIIPKNPEDRKKMQQINASDVIIDDLERLSKSVNIFEAGDFGLERIIKGGQTYIESLLQTNPDATMLDSQAAKLATLMRSLGEVGVLTDKDIERGQNLIPRITDTKTIADRKISELRNFFTEIRRSQMESISTPFRKPKTEKTKKSGVPEVGGTFQGEKVLNVEKVE